MRFVSNYAQRAPPRRRDRHGGRHAARKRHRVDVDQPGRRQVRRSGDRAVRRQHVPGQLRLRAEGLRPEAVDRPQAGQAHGPLRADDRRRRPPGGGRLGFRRRARGRAHRRLDRDRNRRAPGVSGLLRHPAQARPRSREPVSIPQIIPNMGAAWVSMELGTPGPAGVPVHRLRGVQHGDRRGGAT